MSLKTSLFPRLFLGCSFFFFFQPFASFLIDSFLALFIRTTVRNNRNREFLPFDFLCFLRYTNELASTLIAQRGRRLNRCVFQSKAIIAQIRIFLKL